MNLPDQIPAHQLLTPDMARVIYARLAEVAEAGMQVPDDGQSYDHEINATIASASEQIQQAVVDFVQAEIERAERNGRPFRLVARRP